MNPLPDRIALVAVVVTIGLVFAMVFWSVRLSRPQADPPLLWRDPPRGGLAL